MGAGAWRNVYSLRRMASLRRLRYVKSGNVVSARILPPGFEYHLFLSHVWDTGQDQVRLIKERTPSPSRLLSSPVVSSRLVLSSPLVSSPLVSSPLVSSHLIPSHPISSQVRIVKERLLDTFPPGLRVFLDVDQVDFEIGDLKGYIDRSDVVLVLATRTYFRSKNCMIELHHAISTNKQLVCVLEPEAKRGGLTRHELENAALDVYDLATGNSTSLDLVCTTWPPVARPHGT
jgi:hypothetical protein